MKAQHNYLKDVIDFFFKREIVVTLWLVTMGLLIYFGAKDAHMKEGGIFIFSALAVHFIVHVILEEQNRTATIENIKAYLKTSAHTDPIKAAVASSFDEERDKFAKALDDRITTRFNELQNHARFSVKDSVPDFYKSILDTVHVPAFNRYDVTYFNVEPPVSARLPYFTMLSKRLAGGARMRRIVTFNNPNKSAWVLLNLMEDSLNHNNLKIAFLPQSSTKIEIPNMSLYYSIDGDEVRSGISWIHGNSHTNHKFIQIDNRLMTNELVILFGCWFESCQPINFASPDGSAVKNAKQAFVTAFAGQTLGTSQQKKLSDAKSFNSNDVIKVLTHYGKENSEIAKFWQDVFIEDTNLSWKGCEW